MVVDFVFACCGLPPILLTCTVFLLLFLAVFGFVLFLFGLSGPGAVLVFRVCSEWIVILLLFNGRFILFLLRGLLVCNNRSCCCKFLSLFVIFILGGRECLWRGHLLIHLIRKVFLLSILFIFRIVGVQHQNVLLLFWL